MDFAPWHALLGSTSEFRQGKVLANTETDIVVVTVADLTFDASL